MIKSLSLYALMSAAAGLFTAALHADTFEFSYDFGGTDNHVVRGTFEGTENGLYVTDVSNVQIFFGGMQMPGDIIGQTRDINGTRVPGPVFSFVWSQNLFYFSDDLSYGDPNFWYFSMGFVDHFGNGAIWAQANTPLVNQLGINMPFNWWDNLIVNDSWILTNTSQTVPDTGASALLILAGLMSLAVMRQRYAS